MITDDVISGEGVQIFQPELVNLYECSIGRPTKIGAFVEIQKGASVGRDCRISSWNVVRTRIKCRTSIGSNATILAGVTIGEGA